MFPYGRPAGRFPTLRQAQAEAKRRINDGERAWVLDDDLKVVWGKAIKPTKRRVEGMEWWRMKEYNTRPQWIAGEDRRK
jgi:hypothetical protein